VQKALAELGDIDFTLKVEPRRYKAVTERAPVEPSLQPSYTPGQEAATREAYGAALAKLARQCPQVVAIDGDTKNSTFSEKLKEVAPERFVEAYIAEQNGGLAWAWPPGAGAVRSTRASHPRLRLHPQASPRPAHCPLRLHAGVSIGEDGPSQMGQDLAMHRALVASTVLHPATPCARAAGRGEAGARRLVYIHHGPRRRCSTQRRSASPWAAAGAAPTQ
jgi:transketolase